MTKKEIFNEINEIENALIIADKYLKLCIKDNKLDEIEEVKAHIAYNVRELNRLQKQFNEM